MITELLVDKAKEFATMAHVGQIRKSGVPYITHPEAVATLLHTPPFKAVAWLHDVLEDTNATESDLRNIFPTEIVEAVLILTRTKAEPYSEFIKRIADSENEIAIRVKLADLTHNLSDLPLGAKRDKYELAHVYLKFRLMVGL